MFATLAMLALAFLGMLLSVLGSFNPHLFADASYSLYLFRLINSSAFASIPHL
ncbi:hypothetical protein BT96DRAFT_916328 [Gymnopus androsaceus JB14]|uniref:Uncharacterized protein n=1 Tax=Gymnopus androsaceus JB14 TaxID=1447944 RepID=A0A6A4I3V2_9AGAR|nr:hypothetical protein BT96DRAFT_916328 [Gymnopus androsaceus JB14]